MARTTNQPPRGQSPARTYGPVKRAATVMASIVFALVLILSFLLISDAVAHMQVRVVPAYAMDEAGLEEVLARDRSQWTDADYDFVYRQTGLTRAYFNGAGSVGTAFVMQCQKDLFYTAASKHDADTFGSAHDYFPDKYFAMAELKPGDVLISSSVHTMGWLNGHAALVVVGGTGNNVRTLQAVTVGTNVMYLTANWFRQSTSFMVLRPKAELVDSQTVQDIVNWAVDNLYGLPYSIYTGIFSAKDQQDNPRDTQCAHLVWQAYKAYGYDIDTTGGPVVSPKNISRSALFDVIQVNGFNLETLW